MNETEREDATEAGSHPELWFELELERIAATDPVLVDEIIRRQEDLERKIIAASKGAQAAPDAEEFIPPRTNGRGA